MTKSIRHPVHTNHLDEPYSSVETFINAIFDKELIVDSFNAEQEHYRLPFMCLQTSKNQPLLTLFDTGASLSLLNHETAAKLGLEVLRKCDLTIASYNSVKTETSNVYRLSLKTYQVGDHESESYCSYICGTPRRLNTVFSAPILNNTDREDLMQYKINPDVFENWKQFEGNPIDLILGNDMSPWMNKLSQRKILRSGRILDITPLGLLLHPTPSQANLPILDENMLINVVDSNEITNDTPESQQPDVGNYFEVVKGEEKDNFENRVIHEISQMWKIENLGIEEPPELSEETKDQKDLLEEFNKTVIINEDGDLEVALPFNGNEANLANNFEIAIIRLKSLITSLAKSKKPGMIEEYDKIIQSQLKSQIIEVVTEENNKDGDPEYFIPHRAVFKEDSQTTKMRVVLDASSHKKNELSLNQCVHPGPSILQPLVGILMRARLSKYLVIADIEKAFHQVRMQPRFRNCTKFLWIKDTSKPPEGKNVIQYRFTRIPFGLASSPFLLAATIKYFLNTSEGKWNERIAENLYVDNVLFTTNNESEIREIVRGSKETFSRMKMNLREYITNCPGVSDTIPDEDKAKDHVIKLLGYLYDSANDTITVKLTPLPEKIPSKRDVASRMAKNFDPLGLISPALVSFKSLIKRIWDNGVKWKEPISGELLTMWKKIQDDFQHKEITVPRVLTPKFDYESVELVVFSDANLEFYGCAAYLLYRFKEPQPPQCGLLIAKSKIRPSKNTRWSIAKLELLGVEIGTSLTSMLIEELHLKMKKVTFFTDSQASFYWIMQNKLKRRAWVANRVKIIEANCEKFRALSLDPSLHHVPGDINPADLTTRPLSTSALINCKLWWEGPKFLKEDPNTWPCRVSGSVSCPTEFRQMVFDELIPSKTGEINIVSTHTSKPMLPRATIKHKTMEALLQRERRVQAMSIQQIPYRSFVPFDSSNDLRKILTRVYKAIRLVVRKLLQNNPDREWNSPWLLKFFGDPSEDLATVLVKRRAMIRKLVITEHYKESITLGYKLPLDINPIEDEDGLLRITRQIDQAGMISRETAQPIVIYKQHKLAELIALETHIINGHPPEQYLVAAIRTKYCIQHDNVLARKVISKCVNCQKVNAKPYAYPYSKILPKCRTNPAVPFGHAGLDYLGPLTCTDKYGVSSEVYVLLYTCLVTRAVHLELICDGTAVSYIRALNMIFNRRGVPESIYSDNARTFILGGDIINSNIRDCPPHPAFFECITQNQIDFVFITPLAPWQGGVYERMVGIVKHQLLKSIGKLSLPYPELQGMLCKVEWMINCRPITPNPNKSSAHLALRPIDFLVPSVPTDIPEDLKGREYPNETNTAKQTRQYITNMSLTRQHLYWQWLTLYLLNLRESKLKNKKCSTLKPKVGQTVLLSQRLLPRKAWHTARILELHQGKDGQCRSATVLVCKWNHKKKSVDRLRYKRAICQLIPLELEDQVEDSEHPNDVCPHREADNPKYKSVPQLGPATLPALPELELGSNTNPHLDNFPTTDAVSDHGLETQIQDHIIGDEDSGYGRENTTTDSSESEEENNNPSGEESPVGIPADSESEDELGPRLPSHNPARLRPLLPRAAKSIPVRYVFISDTEIAADSLDTRPRRTPSVAVDYLVEDVNSASAVNHTLSTTSSLAVYGPDSRHLYLDLVLLFKSIFLDPRTVTVSNPVKRLQQAPRLPV